ncbi:MAG TPA: putative baseplate assembly protein [Paraburkholderia sp.]|nr:putative baseplate assembly protein [Paraburkholderia sp.]
MKADSTPKLSRTEWTASQVAIPVMRALGRGAGNADHASHADPLLDSLEAVLAHYCQVLTGSLNQAPERHLAAFVSLLPVLPVPPVAARAPLAFKASRGAGTGAPPVVPVVVPRYTEVAAPATGGGNAPVVFQTTCDLAVLRAELTRALVVDFRRAVVTDANAIVTGAAPDGATLPAKAQPLVRAMHIGNKAFADSPGLAGVQLAVEVAGAPMTGQSPAIEWGIEAPEGFRPLTPLRDTTQGLTQSGEIAFDAIAPWPQAPVHGIQTCWLTARARPGSGVTAQASSNAGSIPSATIRRLDVTTQHAIDAAPLDAALYGRMPLDTTRDFYPFGERPRFGDVFYAASKHFAAGGARVTVHLTLTNPADGDPDTLPIPPVGRDGDPHVQWDIYTSEGWVPLSVDDQTQALTLSGAVSFVVPANAAPTTIGGVIAGWVRARLISGSYSAARTTMDAGTSSAVVAPSIAGVTVDASITRGPLAPDHVVIDTGLEQYEPDKTANAQRLPFCPFPAFDGTDEALYLGMLAVRDELAAHTLACYVCVLPGDGPPVCSDALPDAPAVRWQVRGATGWNDCVVEDQTDGLRQSGFVTLRIGADVSPWRNAVFDPQGQLLWLRAMREIPVGRDNPSAPEAMSSRIRRIALNAVPAVQAIRLEHELLGSSTGRPAQLFHAARSPFVGEVELDVREGPVGAADAWVRWCCVADFSESGPQAPHFVVDRLAGSVRFGDGRQGRIPPAGGNNLRLSYAAGGGSRGNCAALSVAQLRTTIPYIESVTNVEAASGGQDAQAGPASQGAALAWLRHRDRAVCADDYAALALRASPEVALAAALCADELQPDVPGVQPSPGRVGVSLVPHSEAREPQPSVALLRVVKRYLDERRPAGVELILFGPSYLRVGVSATLMLESGVQAARVIAQCAQCLDRFLHPLTGGANGRGWRFGERPHASDFHHVLAEVDGLDHVQSLRLNFEEAAADAPGARCVLVCAGAHTLRAG